MNGFCRVIFSDGGYFMGFYKNNKKHGKGKKFKADDSLRK